LAAPEMASTRTTLEINCSSGTAPSYSRNTGWITGDLVDVEPAAQREDHPSMFIRKA
jgi:hypothetical protein